MTKMTCRAFWLACATGLTATVGVSAWGVQSAQAKSAAYNLPKDIVSFGFHQRVFGTKPLEQHIGLPSPPPRKPEPKHQGFYYAEAGQWDKLAKLLPTVRDAATKKLLTWLYLKSPDSQASHAAIATFLKDNPNWPSRSVLILRAEEALFRSANLSAHEDWFANGRANTLDGELWLIAQDQKNGAQKAFRNRVRKVWIAYNFTDKQEQDFLNAFGKSLRASDHKARLDRLIWGRNFREARHMLAMVPRPYRLLAEARLAFASRSRTAPMAYDRVDKSLLNDAGLTYEHIRWLRRKGKEDQATKLFLDYTGKRPHSDKWWTEGAILSREAIKNKHYKQAYRLATHTTYGSVWRDSEMQWLAGWIAYEFLKDYSTAKNHFQKLYDMVSTPVSRSRGAYWLAQSLEKQAQTQEAQNWYNIAASDPTTFYGQLATEQLGKIPQDHTPLPQIMTEDMNWISSHEFSDVLWRLHENREDKLFQTFARAFYAQADTPERKRAVVAAIAPLSLGHSVHLARILRKDGIVDLDLSYPTPDWLRVPPSPERALIYSVIRQESNFDIRAHSSAGAKGLMQIMPRTAKYEARIMKRPLSMYALTADPTTNVAIGSHYLSRLLDKYDNSIPLALAAYNAGGRNVQKWLDAYGDPRTGQISMLQWIESIPFRETRNYVQRILENKYIYQNLIKIS